MTDTAPEVRNERATETAARRKVNIAVECSTSRCRHLCEGGRIGISGIFAGIAVAFALSVWAYESGTIVVYVFAALMWLGLGAACLNGRWLRRMIGR